MLALDYNAILDSQYRERKEYKLSSLFFFIHRFLPINWSVNRTNQRLTSQLLALKGTYSYLIENIHEVKDKDLSEGIKVVENTIEQMYTVQSKLESLLISSKFKELQRTNEIASEILEIMYSTLRLLKKNTLKKTLSELSEEAKISISSSNKTMNKILYGR